MFGPIARNCWRHGTWLSIRQILKVLFSSKAQYQCRWNAVKILRERARLRKDYAGFTISEASFLFTTLFRLSLVNSSTPLPHCQFPMKCDAHVQCQYAAVQMKPKVHNIFKVSSPDAIFMRMIIDPHYTISVCLERKTSLFSISYSNFQSPSFPYDDQRLRGEFFLQTTVYPVCSRMHTK